MRFDFAQLKSQARQALHDAMAVPARYIDDDLVMPVDLTVRWHNKIDRFGDLVDTGYSEVIEGVNRVIFNRPQLAARGVQLQAGGELVITSPGYDGVTLVLASMEPHAGPVEEIWLVAQR